MGFFPDTIAAVLDDKRVVMTPLVLFEFDTEDMRVWPGFGTLNLDGFLWSGLGEFGSVDGLEQAVAGAAPVVMFTLSGVSPSLIAKAQTAPEEVRGRTVTVYVQVFQVDETVGGQITTPLDSPYAIWTGVMDVMTYIADAPDRRTIKLTAESEFADRRRPKFGLLTDRDQQLRFPGDRGLEQRADLRNKVLEVPW